MIARHPEVQQRLQEEIDRVIGDDVTRPITMDELNEWHYLERVIKETLRLFPSVPFIGREVQEDFMHSKISSIPLSDFEESFFFEMERRC